MEQHTLYNLFIELIYLLATIMLVGGLLMLVSGIKQLSKNTNTEQHIPWYNYTPILRGAWAMFLGLFFALFVTGIYLASWIAKLPLGIMAIVCAGLSVGSLIRSHQYAILLPPKQRKRKQTQPKE